MFDAVLYVLFPQVRPVLPLDAAVPVVVEGRRAAVRSSQSPVRLPKGPRDCAVEGLTVERADRPEDAQVVVHTVWTGRFEWIELLDGRRRPGHADQFLKLRVWHEG